MKSKLLKIIPPFSSIWIKNKIKSHFEIILKPNCYITNISTCTADRFDEGWKVYVEISHPPAGEYIKSNFTNGSFIVLDNGTVTGFLISQEDCCYNQDLFKEIEDILI